MVERGELAGTDRIRTFGGTRTQTTEVTHAQLLRSHPVSPPCCLQLRRGSGPSGITLYVAAHNVVGAAGDW